MLRIRRVEEKIAQLYPEQEMRCPTHLCIGQEAVAVGVCGALGLKDQVFGSHRSHGHYLAKGGDLKAMMAELYGKATGCSKGKGGSMHLIDPEAGFLGSSPIVGSTIPIAVGAAFSAALRHETRAVVVFFGEAATEEGVFHESLNFAVLKNLPVIFVCENNLYSVYSPLSVRQPDQRQIVEIVKGRGMAAYQGEGNDVLDVWELARSAVERAKQKKGPTFLEFKTYRWLEHCGPNDDSGLGYRSEKELEKWKKACPIRRLETKLLGEKIVTDQSIQELEKKIEREIMEAISFAKESPFPEANELLKEVYV